MRMMMVVALLAVGSGAAQADEDDTKSPGIALGLSLGMTAAGFATIGIGQSLHQNGQGLDTQNVLTGVGVGLAVIGPTTGHIYTGDVWNRGMIVRVAGAGTAVLGSAMVLASIDCRDCAVGYLGVSLVVGGAAGIVVGSIMEATSARESACAYNRAHANKLTIAPLVRRDAGGLGIVGSF